MATAIENSWRLLPHEPPTVALDVSLLWLFSDFENTVNYVHAGHDLPERREAHTVQVTIVAKVDEPGHRLTAVWLLCALVPALL